MFFLEIMMNADGISQCLQIMNALPLLNGIERTDHMHIRKTISGLFTIQS